MSGDPTFDVVQIGFGPVGQTMASLLGRAGHQVAVFERWPDVYPLPRAGHIDHEIMRIFQGVGAAPDVERHAIPIPDYDWFNAAGEVLLHLDWSQPTPSGWESDYLMYQPYMEDALMAAVARTPSVEVHRGWQAVAVRQLADRAEVDFIQGTIEGGRWTPTGATQTVSTRYLIGADGAGSFVRSAAGIGWSDYGFAEDWLVLDIRPHDPELHIDMPAAGQICDPARPVSLFRWLGREHARWEFMLLPGETAEEMTEPARAWELLARWGLSESNATVVRRAVYTFRSLIADSFRQDRVVLIGDAAHLMPPFMGQGMCSGVRDAVNLAWKLDLVLTGRASADLLDTYDTERRPHVDQIIRTSIALGQIVCVSDPEAAAARDQMFLTGQAPPPPPFPSLTAGVIAARQLENGITGQLGVQGRISLDGRTGLADDIAGCGWTLITSERRLLDQLPPERRRTLESLGAVTLHVSRAGCGPSSAVDLDGTYHRWFQTLDAIAVLVRPDYYVYGIAASAEQVSSLLAELERQMFLADAVPADA